MKSFSKIALAALGAALAAAPVAAQSSATVSTSATTRIVAPITITKNSDLAFGTVVRSSTANTNTVTIAAADGARSISGTGTGALATSTSGRATFTVGGEGAQTFSITVPATVVMTSGANNLTVNLVASGATGTLSGTLGTAGTATFGVGGNFVLAQTQVSGNYTGAFNTVVAYN
jgi:Domain of unknown function (DUF4402)